MSKVKFIDKSKYPKCWVCNGTGLKDGEFSNGKICKTCKGTGKFKEYFYNLVYTNKKGQKLCFGVDGLK